MALEPRGSHSATSPSEIRSANMLLIGCHFPDWLSRFLVRVAAPKRLSEQPRRKDFIIESAHALDRERIDA